MTRSTIVKLASILFLLVSVADIYAVIQEDRLVEVIFKPLLMTVLVIIYLAAAKKPNFWFVSGLFFSFWGDVLLLFQERYFVFGLASFLFAHIIYIKIVSGFLQKDLTIKIVSSAVPFVLFFAGIMYLIYPNLGEMFVPVLVYGVTIATFGATALLHYRQEPNTASSWLLIGAILFIVSDSMIALNKFYETNAFYGVAIMVTYIIAQYMICKAMIAKNEY